MLPEDQLQKSINYCLEIVEVITKLTDNIIDSTDHRFESTGQDKKIYIRRNVEQLKRMKNQPWFLAALTFEQLTSINTAISTGETYINSN